MLSYHVTKFTTKSILGYHVIKLTYKISIELYHVTKLTKEIKLSLNLVSVKSLLFGGCFQTFHYCGCVHVV